jgi:NADPH-dependent 2,4-dienoyl-CoA reductase/sulfur reductase-like enzyme
MVERDDDGRTSVPGIFVAGDGGGLAGARAARAQGTLAGIAAARALGRTIAPDGTREEDAARSALARALAFQRALWTIYAAPPLDWQLATPETVVCRCEEVTRGEIEGALDVPDAAIGGVKRDTRAGMGRCQGRYCGPLLAQAACARSGMVPDEHAFFAPRAPVKPVALRAIARKEAE